MAPNLNALIIATFLKIEFKHLVLIIFSLISSAFSVKRGKSEDIIVRNSHLEAKFDAGVGLLRVGYH